jgi:hypothetical protein
MTTNRHSGAAQPRPEPMRATIGGRPMPRRGAYAACVAIMGCRLRGNDEG